MSTRRDFLTLAAGAGVLAANFESDNAVASQLTKPLTSDHLSTRRIPNTHLEASRLALGCALVGTDPKADDFIDRITPMIQTAYNQGITFFDLADVYGAGNAERAMGRALKQSPGMRDRIVIQSKCGYTDHGTVDNSHSYIVRSAEKSLERLSTDHLDILLLHAADQLVEPEEVAKAFDELHRSGKVRYFGVSNHSPDQIEVLRTCVRQPIVANQILLGLLSWFWDENGTVGRERTVTVNYCRAHNIQVQAHSPFRFSYANPPNVLNPPPNPSPELKKAVDLLADIAARYSVSPAAIMIAWLLRHPAGIIPIMGGSKPEYLVEDCAADHVSLSSDEWYSLLKTCGQLGAQKT